jgi:hypothetical protein
MKIQVYAHSDAVPFAAGKRKNDALVPTHSHTRAAVFARSSIVMPSICRWQTDSGRNMGTLHCARRIVMATMDDLGDILKRGLVQRAWSHRTNFTGND